MVNSLSCLLVSEFEFPEEKLREALAPDFAIEEFDYAGSPSEAFQSLLNSSFNLCLMSTRSKEELDAFFSDMRTLGRDKTCAFVKVLPPSSVREDQMHFSSDGFCACISTDLSALDVAELRRALVEEISRMRKEQRSEDIPACVDLALKEVDEAARKRQRGLKASFDRVIASLVRDMMGISKEKSDVFVDTLSNKAESSAAFTATKVDVPEHVLERKLPKLEKTKYTGSSSRVWKKLLNRYGDTK